MLWQWNPPVIQYWHQRIHSFHCQWSLHFHQRYNPWTKAYVVPWIHHGCCCLFKISKNDWGGGGGRTCCFPLLNQSAKVLDERHLYHPILHLWDLLQVCIPIIFVSPHPYINYYYYPHYSSLINAITNFTWQHHLILPLLHPYLRVESCT